MFAMYIAKGMYPDQFQDHEWEHFLGIFVSGGGGAVTYTVSHRCS